MRPNVATLRRAARAFGLAALLGVACAQSGQVPEGDRDRTAPTSAWPPRFEDFPARERYAGTPVTPNLSSHPDASRFGAALWQGARRGPNFAGRYTIVVRGCGRLCREFVILDAMTGRVHGGLTDTPPFHYRLDSRLIVFEETVGSTGGLSCPGCAGAYFVWTDPRLEIVPRK